MTFKKSNYRKTNVAQCYFIIAIQINKYYSKIDITLARGYTYGNKSAQSCYLPS